MKVVRFADYEQRSRQPDAGHPRDPAEPCIIVVLPYDRSSQERPRLFTAEQLDDIAAIIGGAK
jgi:hypothetical protein